MESDCSLSVVAAQGKISNIIPRNDDYENATNLSPSTLEEVNVTSTVTSLRLIGTGTSPMLMKYLRRGTVCTPNALHSLFAAIHVPIRGATRSTYFTGGELVSHSEMDIIFALYSIHTYLASRIYLDLRVRGRHRS